MSSYTPCSLLISPIAALPRGAAPPPFSTFAMDVGKAVAAYMERMVKEVHGMKMLLLDQYTVRFFVCS